MYEFKVGDKIRIKKDIPKEDLSAEAITIGDSIATIKEVVRSTSHSSGAYVLTNFESQGIWID